MGIHTHNTASSFTVQEVPRSHFVDPDSCCPLRTSPLLFQYLKSYPRSDESAKLYYAKCAQWIRERSVNCARLRRNCMLDRPELQRLNGMSVDIVLEADPWECVGLRFRLTEEASAPHRRA